MKRKYGRNRRMTKNINFFKPEKCSKKCKVINVNEDLSLIIILDYKGESFKWNFRLENIPSISLVYFKTQLEKMVLYKTFDIEVLDFKDGYIYGYLFEKIKNKSINSMFRGFINTYETTHNNFRKNEVNQNSITLDTIFEEQQTTFQFVQSHYFL